MREPEIMMKGRKPFCEDVRTGFRNSGIKFLPRLLLFPFALLAHLVLTAAERIKREVSK